MNHECHAEGCTVQVEPRFLMCPRHWNLVEPRLQKLVYVFYRRGQEIDKKPSAAYMAVHHASIACVADREGKKAEFQYHATLSMQWAERIERSAEPGR